MELLIATKKNGYLSVQNKFKGKIYQNPYFLFC